ncbi:recombination and repair protein RecT [Pirellula sp. SH-Sr6A]|uniref:recombinase RecT n=1 Tax=Pirellula sp. SH-Sr6A TaxID=1632865 RepID=UPI00078EBE91|nr:recombinase RecT [Pirellula sp. SH-Sr6A]AMV34380.1 recombination and repair protein RecT [Pirellula sp. SH-Sr6A]
MSEATKEAKPETAIAKKPNGIKDWLKSDALKTQIASVAPKHMAPERVMRIALNAVSRTPKLADCTPESFMRCLLDLSSWGLEPDGRHAHLIPYGTECTLVLDYKGLVTLAYRSGWVKKIHADVVFEGDIFVYSLGTVCQHIPWEFRDDANKPEHKGHFRAAYCVVTMADGIEKHEVMTASEIDAIKAKSRSGNSGPWKDHYTEMAKKTVYRRASKWLPLSPEQADAMERDDDRIIDAVSVAVTQRLSKAAMPLIGANETGDTE